MELLTPVSMKFAVLLYVIPPDRRVDARPDVDENGMKNPVPVPVSVKSMVCAFDPPTPVLIALIAPSASTVILLFV